MNLTEVKAMLKGRRLADPALIHAAILRREADREQQTDLDTLRSEWKESKAALRGAAIARPDSPERLEFTKQVQALHAAGLTDAEIASKTNTHRTTVGEVRRDLGLPVNERLESPEFAAKALALYAEGLTDYQVSVRMGCGTPRVKALREAKGIAEARMRRSSGALPRVRALIRSGWSDEEIARNVGRPLRVVEQVRREMRAESEQKAVGQ